MATAVSAAAPAPRQCVGDCDGDGRVSVSELVLGVQSALGDPEAICEASAPGGDAGFTVAELVRAIANSLEGCPAGPNFVVILADDLGTGDVGVYGSTHIDTPNLDRLAAQGIRFTDAHSPSAVCSSTRYALLTGRYAWRTHHKRFVLFPNEPLLIEPERETIASLLRSRGYSTACIGKWHLGFGDTFPVNWNAPLRPGPLQLGFQSYFGIPTSHNWPPFVFVEDESIFGRQPGERIEVVVANEVRGIAAAREDREVDRRHVERAVRFVERHRHRPFLLYLATAAIHEPITPQENVLGRSSAGLYGDFVAQFDWAVGQIVRTLDRLDLADDTVVIVTSDNGGIADPPGLDAVDHRPSGLLRGAKGDLYEGGHRVPFVVRWPGVIEPGAVSAATITSADLLATFADIVAAPLPPGAGEDSFSFLAALQGRDEEVAHPVVHHGFNGALAVRHGRWKLLESENGGGFGDPFLTQAPQLFHLDEDPREERDLANDHPEKVAELLDLLDEIRASGFRACLATDC